MKISTFFRSFFKIFHRHFHFEIPPQLYQRYGRKFFQDFLTFLPRILFGSPPAISSKIYIVISWRVFPIISSGVAFLQGLFSKVLRHTNFSEIFSMIFLNFATYSNTNFSSNAKGNSSIISFEIYKEIP